MEQTPTRRVRVRNESDHSITHGIMVQPKFPRVRYREVKEAAAEAGMPVTVWIRYLVYRAIDERKEKQRQK